MIATLTSASVTITSESIRQTSGEYLHQIICYRPRKRKKGEGESSTWQRPQCDVADVLHSPSHLALCRRMFTLELFTTSHFHFRNFALSRIRSEDESLKMVHTIATNFYNISNCSNSFNLIVTIINELPNAFLFYFNLNKSRLFDDHN